MASSSIAGARSVGKGAFDRAEILRYAHARAATRMAPHWSQRYGDTYCRFRCGWVPKASYREIFADCLRMVWSDAKAAALSAQLDLDEPALPAEMARQISDLRIIAGAQSFTETYRRIIAEADDIERAARAIRSAFRTAETSKPCSTK